MEGNERISRVGINTKIKGFFFLFYLLTGARAYGAWAIWIVRIWTLIATTTSAVRIIIHIDGGGVGTSVKIVPDGISSGVIDIGNRARTSG